MKRGSGEATPRPVASFPADRLGRVAGCVTAAHNRAKKQAIGAFLVSRMLRRQNATGTGFHVLAWTPGSGHSAVSPMKKARERGLSPGFAAGVTTAGNGNTVNTPAQGCKRLAQAREARQATARKAATQRERCELAARQAATVDAVRSGAALRRHGREGWGAVDRSARSAGRVESVLERRADVRPYLDVSGVLGAPPSPAARQSGARHRSRRRSVAHGDSHAAPP